jgi:hypothetical protein
MQTTMTIWFKPKDTTGALSVKIESTNPYHLTALARNVWDNLNKNFQMVSTRP